MPLFVKKKLENIKSKNIIFCYCVLIAGMLFVRDVLGFSVNKFIFVGVALFFMAIANLKSLIQILCFSFPLLWGLPGTYVLLVAVFCYIVKKRKLEIKDIIPSAIFILMEILASCFYVEFDFNNLVQYICTIFLFFTLITLTNEIDLKETMFMYLLGTLVLCIIVLFSTLKTAPSNWLELFSNGWFRFGDIGVEEQVGISLKLNPNNLGYQCVLGISIGLIMFKHNSRCRILIFICMLFCVVLGILSASRTFILVLGVILLLMIGYSFKSIKTMSIAFLVIAIVISCVVGYMKKNPLVFDGLLTRFTDDTMSTGGGRSDIFKENMSIFYEHIRFWFMGTGVTQYTTITGSDPIHNMFQQMLVCLGGPGMLLFVYYMFIPIIRYFRRVESIYFIPFISFFISIQTNQFLNPSTIMLMYIMVVYAVKFGYEQSKESVFYK